MKTLRSFAFSALVACVLSGLAGAQTWTPLTHQLSLPLGAALLLTDGTVIVHHEDANDGFSDWYKLTPDINGSYVNGTWSQVASLASNYGPLFFASAVLPDGRLIVEGGEQNFGQYVWTNMGAIYDPLTNVWTPMNPPSGWSSIGDASGVVLADGTFMLANCCTSEQALLNASTLSWSSTGAGKFDENDEEGWTLLPGGRVLTVDAYVNLGGGSGTNSEAYDPNTGSWSGTGSTIVQLWDSHGSFEVGPAVLRPDGTVFATGANGNGAGHTSIYNVGAGTWTRGPDFPNNLDIADGPAALLPDGNVLMMTSPGIFQNGSVFFEWDGSHLNQVTGVPNSLVDSSWYGHMLLLPTGQVLFTDYSNDVEIYTPTGNPWPNIQPTALLNVAVLSRGASFVLFGSRFNGVSQGAAYGDDYQAATNYPIVRITNLTTGHVFYCRTHNHSTMAVGYPGPTYTHVDLPANMETGASYLEVVVNGIASQRYMLGIR